MDTEEKEASAGHRTAVLLERRWQIVAGLCVTVAVGYASWEIESRQHEKQISDVQDAPDRSSVMFSPLLATQISHWKDYEVEIPSGAFYMGCTSKDMGCNTEEQNLHLVELTHAFYMMKGEVSQGLWREVMGSNPSLFLSCGDDCPVEQVSWNDAVEFSNRLNESLGLERCYEITQSDVIWRKGYDCAGWRLPTEAEWEYAARGGQGYQFAVGDYDNDGLNDIYFSNIDFLAAKRIQSNHPELTDIFQGNRLYRNQGDGTFADVTETAGVGWAGEAAAGATWFDYDSDGDLDLYVTNGLWTGPKSQDLSSTFVRAYIADSHNGSQASKTDLDALSLQDPGFYHLLLESLSNFSGDLNDESSFQDAGVPSLSLGGNQRNVLFQNNGDGTFTDVAYVVGLDSIDDGYMASVADVNLDGKPDVILRNCDPGTPAYTYPSLRIYQNQSTAPEQLAIQLRGNGVDTNVDSIGAQIRVFAKADSAPMIRELATVNGAAQSENVAFFGLGEIAAASRVEVLWPNGDVTEHGPFSIGRHTIVQPK